jgi:pilus assembly protein TadC
MTTAISEAGVEPTLKHFDELPDSAHVDIGVVAALLAFPLLRFTDASQKASCRPPPAS